MGDVPNISAGEADIGQHAVVELHQFIDAATNSASVPDLVDQSSDYFHQRMPGCGRSLTPGRQYRCFDR